MEDQSSDPIKRLERIKNICRDFEQAAKLFATLIVNDCCQQEKFVEAYRMKNLGLHGGEKYVFQGIFFKFAVDKILKYNDKSFYLFGGEEKKNHLAMKAAGNELKHLNSWFGTVNKKETKKICFPLMCVIDLKGFRLVAMSYLPLANFQIYGRVESTLEVLTFDPEFNELVASNARKLGLGSLTLSDGREFWGPVDIEGFQLFTTSISFFFCVIFLFSKDTKEQTRDITCSM